MSAGDTTHIDVIARALADTADDGCFNNPPTYDSEGFLDLDVALDEWHSGEEDRAHWTKLARASVSKLTDAGYSIVPTSEVDSLNAFRWRALQNLAAAAEGEEP